MPDGQSFGALAVRPGKVVAVHLNYESRIAQRGRRPEQPSYFLKPASSVSASGDTIERPASTELLGFEGEIALIIGAPARRIAPEQAWSHVSGVTAANDFGVYDLRWADRGSNLRAKGGDGFTPLGPSVLDAAGLDPAGLRVRTWVNGKLAQQGTSAELAFPFARLIADLSQLMTLEPGDVILTGTPAGASVVVPGDVVEVEVDALDTPGAPSTGRLVTRVAEGTAPLAGYGAQPKIDDVQREEAWAAVRRQACRPPSNSRGGCGTSWPASRPRPCPRSCASGLRRHVDRRAEADQAGREGGRPGPHAALHRVPGRPVRRPRRRK